MEVDELQKYWSPLHLTHRSYILQTTASNISSLSLTQLHFDDQISVKNWHNIIVAYAQWQTLCKREAYFFLFILCNIISSWSSFSSSKHCLLTASYFLFTATITKQRNSMYRGNWLHLILCILQIRWFYQLIRYIVFDGLVVCSKREEILEAVVCRIYERWVRWRGLQYFCSSSTSMAFRK